MTDTEAGATGRAPDATEEFRAARDLLLRHREDYDAARTAFRWPRPEHFNDLSALRHPPREIVAAGEPLNPEIIEQVRQSWGVTIRDGFGQTETAVQVANTPGQTVKPGSMGRPTPGFDVVLLDPVSGAPADEGEIALDLSARPVGLMTGYHGDPVRTAEAMADGYYRTGDIGIRDRDGWITYVGRADDVFKASGSGGIPFQLRLAA
ncbi:Acyl-coenzyme A synthetases/AMP-(fatty) acid ligases [Streptomyces sp. SceaMP-e96]|uniref:AMP-binding protein n=1 Tax=unclassified Streptomyces TaxID=2593676 RepID=UPI0008239F7D|nr:MULTISPECIES: AMP-binding protein [unclassified Streptomyces]SCK60073.1 Acyl-coenzyme A synthetases/AMP-(fatty) acid ligases [Streptomyces sp. SceaMP-e96]